jgi:hypothetical protein
LGNPGDGRDDSTAGPNGSRKLPVCPSSGLSLLRSLLRSAKGLRRCFGHVRGTLTAGGWKGVKLSVPKTVGPLAVIVDQDLYHEEKALVAVLQGMGSTPHALLLMIPLRYLMRCLVLALTATLLYGQSSPPLTFHAYANLLQIPVLVLSPYLKPLPLISASKFAISLDSGPKFRPTHVRLEGDDPISLAILLDVSEPDAELVPDIEDAIAGLSPTFLNRSDRVSIYALDCSLTRSLYDVPADSTELKNGVEVALRLWNSRRQRKEARCKKTMHLWDTLVYITENLSSRPGRRVILAVTDGRDWGSSNTWNGLRRFAAASSVAIFGMTSHESIPSPEDVFDSVCGLTGGLVLTTNRAKISQDLERFTTMLRERYILEFPRTDNAPAGPHRIDVTVLNSNAVIRTTGITVPIEDPRILADPTTVPSDPSHAPQLGKRRILTPN